jgi:hypothetical protein
MNNNNSKVVLNQDEKEVLLKELKDLYFATKQLYNWISEDNLTAEMKGLLPHLIEGHFKDVAKILNYESNLTKEVEERYLQIRKANDRIRSLELKLAQNKPLDGLPEQLTYLARIVTKWWNQYGFHHVSDHCFTEYGYYTAKFCFMLDHITMFSDTPATDRKSKKERLKELEDQGYQIVYDDSGRQPELLDNDNNRQKLIELIERCFPSAIIARTRNHYSDKRGVYTFRDIEVYIYDLTDITNKEI